MKASELFAVSTDALAITGSPEWDAPDDPGHRDVLIYIDDESAGDDGPLWCLAPSGSLEADYVAVDAVMADELIRGRLRGWLLERGWQVQAALRKEAQRWRLVDVLSIADGGGDRLDDDYPYGTDELAVLCASIVVITHGGG